MLSGETRWERQETRDKNQESRKEKVQGLFELGSRWRRVSEKCSV
jgi:hypothetical protein